MISFIPHQYMISSYIPSIHEFIYITAIHDCVFIFTTSIPCSSCTPLLNDCVFIYTTSIYDLIYTKSIHNLIYTDSIHDLIYTTSMHNFILYHNLVRALLLQRHVQRQVEGGAAKKERLQHRLRSP